MPSNGPSIAVAIPVKDEASHIRACLEALDAQVGARADHIVLLINNSTDATSTIARNVSLHGLTKLHLREVVLPVEHASAGHARRLAMEEAARLVGPTGIVLTTDADGEVDRDWIDANLMAVRQGADAVAGWVELHPIDWGLIPSRLHEDDAREGSYDQICDEIHALLDPDIADPWPRHTQNSGASIAVTAQAFRRCGGVPHVACGEDRALIAALRSIDARIRHSPAVHVTVSGRTNGRALGGMADTIRRRLTEPDKVLDRRLEPVLACAFRAQARARFKTLYETRGDVFDLAVQLQIDPQDVAQLLAAPFFGEAWRNLEGISPLLCHQPVLIADLATQVDLGSQLLRMLRARKAANLLEAQMIT